MKPQPRKKLRLPKITTRDEDPLTDLGIGLDGPMIMGLSCQHHDHLLEEISGQIIRLLTTSDKLDPSSEKTTRITTVVDTMTVRSQYHSDQDQSRNLGSNNNYS